jgi:hypothetical protein
MLKLELSQMAPKLRSRESVPLAPIEKILRVLNGGKREDNIY